MQIEIKPLTLPPEYSMSRFTASNGADLVGLSDQLDFDPPQ